MLIYIFIFLLLTFVCYISFRYKNIEDPNILIGNWFCNYQDPLILGKKQKKKERLSKYKYLITLQNNGTGFLTKTYLNQRQQPIYFTWVCESSLIIIDSENWDKSNPRYLKIIELNEESCTLKVLELPQKERVPKSFSKQFEHSIYS